MLSLNRLGSCTRLWILCYPLAYKIWDQLRLIRDPLRGIMDTGVNISSSIFQRAFHPEGWLLSNPGMCLTLHQLPHCSGQKWECTAGTVLAVQNLRLGKTVQGKSRSKTRAPRILYSRYSQLLSGLAWILWRFLRVHTISIASKEK